MAQILSACFIVIVIILGPAEGFFPYTFKDNSLMISSYVKMFNVDWFECVEQCSRDFQCSSYTYIHPIAPNQGGLCELYDCGFDQCTPGKTLVFRRGSVFQQIKPSHSGSSCIKELGACASVPCQNGGSCTDDKDGFVCKCRNGYSGNTCQVKHEGTCNSTLCFNGGTCHSNNEGVYWCDCHPNHLGYQCFALLVVDYLGQDCRYGPQYYSRRFRHSTSSANMSF